MKILFFTFFSMLRNEAVWLPWYQYFFSFHSNHENYLNVPCVQFKSWYLVMQSVIWISL